MNKYIEYIKKVQKGLNHVSHTQSVCKAYLYFDYICAVISHRCLIRQYVIGEFWRKSHAERKKCLTYNRIVKLFDQLNKKEYIHILNEKQDFNTYFKEFVHRDWLDINQASEESVISFIKSHTSVIIKPINGVEGGGIRKFVLSDAPNTDLSKLYKELKAENVIIEEVIKQNERMVFEILL